MYLEERLPRGTSFIAVSSGVVSAGAVRLILCSVALFMYGGFSAESEKKIIAQKEKPPAKLRVAYLWRMKQSAI